MQEVVSLPTSPNFMVKDFKNPGSRAVICKLYGCGRGEQAELLPVFFISEGPAEMQQPGPHGPGQVRDLSPGFLPEAVGSLSQGVRKAGKKSHLFTELGPGPLKRMQLTSVESWLSSLNMQSLKDIFNHFK